MKKAFFLSAILMVLFSACKNDLDIIADQEEVIIIYGLLNKNDSIQYFKINKGFASQTEAPIYLAQQPDQLFYDSLQVQLIDRTDNKTFDCYKVMMAKDTGTFTNAVNYIYATNEKLYTGHTYELYVLNKETGHEATSQINLIGDPTPKSPNELNINTYPIFSDKQITISYDADAIYSTTYEIRMNFIFEEIDNNASTITIDTVRWVIATGKFGDSKKIIIRSPGADFYNNLANNLEQKGSEISRRGRFLQMEYWTGDNELSTYIDVYGSSSIGVVQKKTDYTNIIGGYGIFASRNRYLITGQKLDNSILNELKTNPILTKFNFVD